MIKVFVNLSVFQISEILSFFFSTKSFLISTGSGIKHLEEIRKLKDVSVNVPHVNEIQIHPWCQNKSIVEYCRQHNIVIEAYSPLARSQKWSDQTIQSVSKKVTYHFFF